MWYFLLPLHLKKETDYTGCFVDKPFFFTYQKSADGGLAFGNGTNEDPFVVGITTKQLLKGLLTAFEKARNEPGVYHLQVRLK